MAEDDKACPLCGRKVRKLREHHLVPKSRGGKETVSICSMCHRQIHALFHNKTLASRYSTLASLKKAPELRSYLKWIRNKPDRRFRTTPSKRKR